MRLFILSSCLLLSISLSAQTVASDQQAQQLLDSLDWATATGSNNDRLAIWINELEQYYKAQNNKNKLLETLLWKVNLYNSNAYYQEAFTILKSLNSSIENNETLPPAITGAWHLEYASLLSAQGDYDKAIADLKSAIPFFQKAKNWTQLSTSYYYLIYNMYYSPNYGFEEMRSYLDILTETILPKLPKTYSIHSASYSLVGAIYYAKGNYQKALKVYQKSLDLEYKYPKPDLSSIASLHTNMAIMYEYTGDYNMAKLNYIEADALYSKLKDVEGLVGTRGGVANMFYSLGRKELAKPRYLSALEVVEDFPINDKMPFQLALKIYKLVSEYYLHYDEPDKVIEYINQNAQYINSKGGINSLSQTYSALSKAYLQKKDYAQAKSYAYQYLQIAKNSTTANPTQLSQAYSKLSDIAAVEQNFQQRLIYLDSVVWALLPTSNKEISLENILETDAKSSIYEALLSKSATYIQLQLWQKAYQTLLLNIALINELKHEYSSQTAKSDAALKFKDTYDLIIKTLLNLQKKNLHVNYNKEIFQYMEQSKASLLNESILKYRNQNKNEWEIPDSLIKKEEKLLKKLDWYRGQIRLLNKNKNSTEKQQLSAERLKIAQELERLENNLAENYPSYKKWEKDLDKGYAVEDVQKDLDDNTLVIEYYRYLDQLLIFYITKDSTDIVSKSIADGKLKQLIGTLRGSLTNISNITAKPKKSYENFSQSAYELYKEYIAHPFLAKHKKLIVIPDYQLYYVPFSVLLNKPAPKQLGYTNLSYLLREYTIHYEYSSALLLHNKSHQNQATHKLLGLAPLYGQQKYKYNNLADPVKALRTAAEVGLHNQLAELQGTKAELNSLKKQFEGSFWVDKDAAEHSFKENCSKYSILHLAMHGLVDKLNPGNSALALTETLDSLEDNLLYAYEINYLDLRNTDLVVLSACETGYGEYQNGEGVLSIGRSFMQAGVPSLLMTLWELSDQSSVVIIEQFYKKIKEGLSKDEALRQAKLYYLNNAKGLASHPFFWAAFVNIGNNSPLVSTATSPTAYGLIGGGILVLVLGFFLLRKLLKNRQKRES